MFKIYDNLDEFKKENNLNNKEKNLMIDNYKLNNHNYLIKTDNNHLMSINDYLYLNNDSDIDEIKDILINYNLKFDYTDNYELINKYNEFIKGEIIFNNNLYHINNKKINNIILAGGCFWCSALPFYQKKNIINVICGYTGGKMHMPKYEDVKKKITGHKEAMLIYYDISDINFDEIISTYLNSIDPFDDGGQFMDRGSNYTLGAYFNDEEEINKFKNILKEKEEIWQKKAMIDISYQNIFYKAEEEHQEFYKKNPKRMELEFKEREKYKKSYDI